MAHVLDDGTIGLTDLDWEIEKGMMLRIAFSILRDGAAGKQSDETPIDLTRKDVDRAFSLFSMSCDWSELDCAPLRARFDMALNNANPINKRVLLRNAYGKLVNHLGFELPLEIQPLEGSSFKLEN